MARPVLVYMEVTPPGVVIVVCSPGYHSSSIVVRNFVSIVLCIVISVDMLKKDCSKNIRKSENGMKNHSFMSKKIAVSH